MEKKSSNFSNPSVFLAFSSDSLVECLRNNTGNCVVSYQSSFSSSSSNPSRNIQNSIISHSNWICIFPSNMWYSWVSSVYGSLYTWKIIWMIVEFIYLRYRVTCTNISQRKSQLKYYIHVQSDLTSRPSLLEKNFPSALVIPMSLRNRMQWLSSILMRKRIIPDGSNNIYKQKDTLILFFLLSCEG